MYARKEAGSNMSWTNRNGSQNYREEQTTEKRISPVE